MLNTKEQISTQPPIAPYLIGLNEKQTIAVTHTEGPSIVIAGAGSGKTKVLTARIAHVLKENKATPNQILALTFTNKAAAEMRHRIEQVVGDQAKALWLGTFHSVFVKLLRREAAALGYPTYFSIYDSEDSKSLLKQLIKDLNLDDKVYRLNVVLGRISHAKNRLISPQSYAADALYQAEDMKMRMPRFSELYLRYVQYCSRAGAMDFDDLLVYMHKILYTHTELCKKYQQTFRYLFIDEFQDTNLVQYKIIQKLAEVHQNICVVGDDAQSIYAFRGADIQNILHFTRDYPHHQMVKLEQNYRSTQHIVDTANHIIQHNESQLKKTVWTDNTQGEPIQLVKAMSDLEESRMVVASILAQKRKHGLVYQDFVILYRTNNQSRNFEEALRKQNIPYRIVGGLSFYQRKEIKDFLAYLRFVVNPNDASSFKRIINLPKRGVGAVTLDKIFTLVHEKGETLWHVLSHLEQFLTGAAVVAIRRFVAFISSVADQLALKDAYTLASYVAKESGFLKELYEDKTIEGLTRYEHLQELLNSIKQFVDHAADTDPSLGSFLQEVSLITNGDQDNVGEDVVTLMTIHSVKGMEFNHVYLVGMEEELFPSAMMLGSKTDLEEERRLFYVAVTRARLKVIISYALSRYRFGKLSHTQPSRFLKEINLEPNALSVTATAPRALSAINRSDQTFGDLKVGSSVKHAHFGEGKVVQLVDTEDLYKAVVFFSSVGKKTLLLHYAKLELLPTR
ncbi:MAG: UvrD-helicase domain-containing protein [Amoebophilaceae bacterium]|nr:UvrD-helicase domain-containing protein [Amoebophilaceae bacterium]